MIGDEVAALALLNPEIGLKASNISRWIE